MKRLILVMVVVIAIVGGLSYYNYDSLNRDFTPWMSEPDLSVYVQKFDTSKPGTPDWKKTHWITAAEGRWNNGIAEYRIRTAEAPKVPDFVWYWFINMDQAAFSEKIQGYEKGGFALVYTNSYKLPDGTTRYQGVWHKPGQ